MCVCVLLLGQTMNNLAKSTISQDNKQKVEMWKHGLVIWNRHGRPSWIWEKYLWWSSQVLTRIHKSERNMNYSLMDYDRELINYLLQVFRGMEGYLATSSLSGLDTLYNISLIIIIIKPPAGLTHYWINTWPVTININNNFKSWTWTQIEWISILILVVKFMGAALTHCAIISLE